MLVICKCRVCGKDYEACHTIRPTSEYFRWQDVACSPECGAKYLADIMASRAVPKKEAVAEPVTDGAEESEAVTEDVKDTAPTKKKTKKNKA